MATDQSQKKSENKQRSGLRENKCFEESIQTVSSAGGDEVGFVVFFWPLGVAIVKGVTSEVWAKILSKLLPGISKECFGVSGTRHPFCKPWLVNLVNHLA